jgi:AhpD family alkylhydroperoxidase
LTEKILEFQQERERLNKLVLERSNLAIKRFYNLDTQVYQDGALSAKFKEMLGLVASFVLRCDDCITYHIMRCHEEGVSDEELAEVLAVGLVVGGSITIPHQRRAMERWEELNRLAQSRPQEE